MFGSLIGAGLKVAGSVAGGIAASKSAKKTTGLVEDQRAKNEQWFNRAYNEDATQRADALRMMSMTEESIRNRNKDAAASAAVMGGTAEGVAAAKAANNQALSDTASRITASAANRKDQIEQAYMAKDQAYNDQLISIEQEKAKAIAEAVKGAANDASSIAGLSLPGKN